MKKLSLILAALVLFAGVSFAKQLSPDPAKGATAKSDKAAAKSDKKAPAKKEAKKSDKKDASTKPAAK